MKKEEQVAHRLMGIEPTCQNCVSWEAEKRRRSELFLTKCLEEKGRAYGLDTFYHSTCDRFSPEVWESRVHE